MGDHKEKVKVAVRIRPISLHADFTFSTANPHQKTTDAIKIVYPGEMKNELFLQKIDGNMTETEHFDFDYCFWPPEQVGEKRNGELATENKQLNSHNKQSAERGIFDDIGKEILQSAWEGYNVAILAYGQSGSGKSWTLWGNGNAKGLLSYLSSEIQKTIKEKDKHQLQSNDAFYEVKFGMVEIYNECMVDLSVSPTDHLTKKEFLNHEKDFKKGAVVTSSEELMLKFEEGMTNRSKFYCYMNLQSEKGYTCVAMTLIQRKKNGKGDEVRKSSVIHLIEIPGMDEIHLLTSKKKVSYESSLVSLDKCIRILMDEDRNIKKEIGDSVAANYLYKAFVENSKTFLIASVTQHAENYDIILSTLCFVKEVQQLFTRPRINEESMQKLIRDLKNENDYLRKLLANHESNETAMVEQIQLSKLNLQTVNKEEIKKQWTETIKMQIKENEREIKGMSLTYEDKLKQGKLDRSVDKALLKKFESDKKQKPHFNNLHSDPQINGRLVHFFSSGSSIISGDIANKDKEYFMHMPGIGIEDCHAVVTYFPKENRITLKPCFSGCRIRLNGMMIQNEMTLSNYDRITIGAGQIWLLKNPKEQNILKIHTIPTYRMAEDENFGHCEIFGPYTEKFSSLRFSCLKKLIPVVEDANTMSKKLDKKVRFEIVTWPDENENRDTEFFESLGNVLKPGENVQILFKDTKLGFCNIWSAETFLRRVDDMKFFYSECHRKIDKSEDGNINVDPFQQSTDVEIFIGHAKMPLKPLAYLIDYRQYFDIVDITNDTIGRIEMTIAPCDISGIDYVESCNVFLQDPYELIAKSLHSKFKIIHCSNIFPKYKNVCCRYELSLGTKVIMKETCYCFAKEQKFDHEQIITFGHLSKEAIDSLLTGSIMVKIYGKLNVNDKLNKSSFTGIKKPNFASVDPSNRSIITELKMNDSNRNTQNIVDFTISKKLEFRQKEKFKSLQLLVEQTANIGVENIPVNVVKLVAHSSSKLKADEVIDTFLEESRQSIENLEEKEKKHHSRTCTMQ